MKAQGARGTPALPGLQNRLFATSRNFCVCNGFLAGPLRIIEIPGVCPPQPDSYAEDLKGEGVMPESPQEFQRLMEWVRAGSAEAIRELLDSYGPSILHVVRRRLHKRLRPKFDSSDFVQSVWASFFATSLERHSFNQPRDRAAFLAAMAQNQVTDAVRQRLRCQRYNVNRERSLDGSAALEAADLTDHSPTPRQGAMAKEKWEQLQRRARRPGRVILELLRQGVAPGAVADQLGLDSKTVWRLIHHLRSEPGA
jgi:RNA polymerase sigma factor (sigma-70 family)